jgi:putative membrane protein
MNFTRPRNAMSFLATLLFAATAASAQQPSMPQSSAAVQPDPGQPKTALSRMDNDSTGHAPSTPNYADQSFVEDMLKNNEAQVQMSQLAQQKASYSDVKEFGVRMIEIHTKLNEQLAPLAKQLDVNQNPKPSKEQKKEIAQLEQLSGTDFDHAYLQAMAREQAHSVKQFKHAQSATNPYIQKAGTTDEPVLDQHYQILQKIAQTHNVTLAANE